MKPPGHRRILHQPLVPIQWTPPPPPPPSPPNIFAPSPIAKTTASPPTQPDSTTRTAIIVSSVTIGVLFFLSILFLLYQKREVRKSPSKSKREASYGSFLAPAGNDNSEVGSTGSVYHAEEEVQLDLTQPSPEIKPLPPLATREPLLLSLSHSSPEIKPLAPLRRQPLDNAASSDEDVQVHTPKMSLEKSYSWSGTARFSKGSSPILSQQQTPPPAQPINLHENLDDGLASNGMGIDSSDTSTVWGKFKSRSLRFDDDMIEMITTSFRKESMARREGALLAKWDERVLSQEKAESVEILLRALNLTTDDVRGALLDGKNLFKFFENSFSNSPLFSHTVPVPVFLLRFKFYFFFLIVRKTPLVPKTDRFK